MSLTNILGETGTKVLLFSLMFAVFYFFIIRPKHIEEQAREDFLQSLKKGKKVITTAGIHGSIIDVGETTVVIEVDRKGSQLTLEKSSISSGDRS